MKFNKKAIAAGFLVVLVITLVSFFLLAGTILNFNKQSEEKQKVTLCKDSVRLRASTALSLGGGVEEIKYSPLLCQTIDKKVSGKKEDVEKAIADSMATCWQMFGEGRFKKNIFDTISSFGGDARCFMCYTILVDPSLKFGEKDSIRDLDFQQYLRTTTYRSYTPPNSKENTPAQKESYLQYLQTGGGPGYFFGFLTDQGVKPGRAYAVMYKAKRTDCGVGCTAAVLGGGLSTLLNSFTGNFVGIFVSGGAMIAGGAKLIEDALTAETQIDGIFLVDMTDPNLRSAFANHCSYVSDLAGG
ncbi:hypothetical protein HYT55_05090 [Candidatus Woesearchaeota archaeon]|nr:hypothetical protein [Candidatus Woesearchaeota archaeon]